MRPAAHRRPRADGDLAGARIATSFDLGQGPIDPETRRVFAAALDDLRAAGATVEEVPIELPDPADYWGPEYLELAGMMGDLEIDVWPLIADVCERAAKCSTAELNAAMRRTKTDIYRAYADIFATFDLFACPTTPVPAFPHVGDIGGPAEVDGVELENPGLFLHRMTESPSHAGLPAMSVPCGFTAGGLPVGLQLVAPLHADTAMISAAARYERATGWADRRPRLP